MTYNGFMNLGLIPGVPFGEEHRAYVWPLEVSPGFFQNHNTFYSFAVIPGVRTIQAAYLAPANQFFSATVVPGMVTVGMSYSADADSFPAMTVTRKLQQIQMALFGNINQFYAATVKPTRDVPMSFFQNDNSFFDFVIGANLDMAFYQNVNSFPSHTVVPTYRATMAFFDDSDSFPAMDVDTLTYSAPMGFFQNVNSFPALTVVPGVRVIQTAFHQETNQLYGMNVVQNVHMVTYAETNQFFSLTAVFLTIPVPMSFFQNTNTFPAAKAVQRPWLAGYRAGGGSSGTQTADLTDISGGAYTLVEGDYVIATICAPSTSDLTGVCISSGWTTVADLYASDTLDCNMMTVAKMMGPTPDTSVSFTGMSPYGIIVRVYKGVDLAQPLDVASTTAFGTNTDRPNPPAITPTTRMSTIVAIGAGVMTGNAPTQTLAQTASQLSDFQSYGVDQADTNGRLIASGDYKSWSSGSFDPVQFVGGTNNAANSWCAVTMALRPK